MRPMTTDPGHGDWFYQEAVHRGETTIAYYVDLARDLGHAAEGNTRTALAILGGMLTVVAFLMDQVDVLVNPWSLGLAAGILLVLVGMLTLAFAAKGSWRSSRIRTGPGADYVLLLRKEGAIGRKEVQASVAGMLASHAFRNLGLMTRLSDVQGRALSLVMVGVVVFLFALAFIVGGAIIA